MNICKMKTATIAKITVSFLALMILTSSVVSFAQTYKNKYVYGSDYTVVADGKSDNSAQYLTVTVNKINKADGDPSSYTKVKADVLNSSGSQISTNTNIVLRLGEATSIPLNKKYASGTAMKLRMKGNNSCLDCIVDFATAISSN